MLAAADLEKPSLMRIENTPQTLRDIVQERMRAAIIEGHFAPGERLVERPLCDQLGVSRTVIRETIRFLEAEGLVENLPNRGPIVARLDWDQAKQIYEIRRQLEGAAAAACAKGYQDGFAAELGAALADLTSATKEADWTRLLHASTAFYEGIFLQAGHSVAWEVVQRLNARISRLRRLTLSVPDRPRPGISHMTAIHDAVLSRDAKAAREAVQAHLKDAAKIAKQFLKDDEKAEPPDA